MKIYLFFESKVPDWQGGASTPAKTTRDCLQSKRGTSPISAMSRKPRTGPTPTIRITTGYSGNCESSVSTSHAIELLDKVEISGSHVLADRAYGAQAVRAYISKHGANYVIPPQSNISEPWSVDWHLYKRHHLIKCFFQRIKWFHRIATRYDKLDAFFLAFIYLAAIAFC